MNKDISQILQATILFISSFVFVNPALAQIKTDDTVPTQVNQSGNVTEITGGAERGNNLFHSFQEFSIPTGKEAFFNNVLNIENIFSRVTGGSLSNIDGLIRANGSANLFLINPAGILFGANARLDIGGSFYGSTADSLLFDEGIEFSAVNSQNPILTINAPIGLRFRDNPAAITNSSIAPNIVGTAPNGSPIIRQGLLVKPNQTLALVGGDINLEKGGILEALTGGKIDLGGLSTAGTINFNADGSLSFPDGITKANVSLVDSTIGIFDVGENGGISINARNLKLSGSNTPGGSLVVAISNISSQQRNKATISINASEKVSLTEQSNIFSQLAGDAVGRVKGIEVNTGSLEIISSTPLSLNPAQIAVVGQSPNVVQDKVDVLTINASEKISIDQGAIQAQVLTGGGQRGNATISTGSLELTNNAAVFLNNFTATGEVTDAGSLNINADRIVVDNSTISTFLGEVLASDIGTNIEITANSLELNQGTLNAATATGTGGNIKLDIDNNITLSNSSQITAESTGNANGGNIEIETEQLTVQSDSVITASARGQGSGGVLDIEADSLNINNQGRIGAEAVTGTGGNLTLDIDDNITLSNGSFISARSSGNADGGSIDLETENLIINNSEITASATGEGSGGILKIEADSLNLNRGTISAEAAAGTGGNITLDIDDNIILRNNSQITAKATGDADGGDINIETDFIIAPPNQNSDILASAEEQGTGGRIFIEAEGIFGLEVRPQNDTTNDIDASGGVDGEVIINTPDVDISKGAIQTPQNVLVLEQIVAQACSSNGIARGNSTLIVNGKGGVPPKLIAPIRSDAIYIEGETVNTQVEIAKKNLYADIYNKKKNKARDIVTLVENNQPVTIDDIIPAQGAIILENGDVVLTAYPTSNRGYRFPDARKNCAI